MFGNMGSTEWIIVLAIILVLFGPKNLPRLAQSIGKSIRELKNGMHGLGEDLKDTMQEPPSQPMTPNTSVQPPAPETQPKAVASSDKPENV